MERGETQDHELTLDEIEIEGHKKDTATRLLHAMSGFLEGEARAMKGKLYNNCAMCLYKLGSYVRAADNCRLALELDPENVKALYRRAQANERLKEYDSGEKPALFAPFCCVRTLTRAPPAAKKDLKKAAKLAPDDKAIARLAKRVDALIARRKAKERKMAQKMFS